MDANIRKAQNKDIEILSKLATDSFVHAYKSTLPEKELLQYSQTAFSHSTIEEIIKNNTAIFLVAENKDGLVGYIHLEPLPPPLLIPNSQSPTEMVRLYTKIGHEGRGIGSRLFIESLLLCKKASHDYMWLQVWEGNKGAQHFYQSFGLEPLGTQPYAAKCLSRPVTIMGQTVDVLFGQIGDRP